MAETLSIAGDQLARVALSVLVFDQTRSATATALTYAATYLPAILGGAVLARVGDRLPRRAVMVGCDLVRAGLFAAMAIHGLPLAAIVLMLVIAVFLGPAFTASEVSYLAIALDRERFRVATGVRMITGQIAQVGGFALGGVLVAALAPRPALLVDAVTYLVSAVVIGIALRAGAGSAGKQVEPTGSERREFRGLWRDRRLRGLLMLAALAGFFVVPEGLAVPFGRSTGASTAETGLLLASIPLGGALGALLLVRFVAPRQRFTVARCMAIGCGLPLVVTAFAPHWPLALGCWLLSGLLAAYQVEVTTSIIQSIPDVLRARLIGAVSSVLLGAQGAGLVVFGAVAHGESAGRSIGLAGLAGSAAAALVVLGPLRPAPQHRHRHHRPARPSGPDERDGLGRATSAAGPFRLPPEKRTASAPAPRRGVEIKPL